ncbi:MAG: hypothetical protein JW841_13925 [Deltaproteobacteria bacterium]|nr:hypothetical protein [Deltaproteobacteria bacterium]
MTNTEICSRCDSNDNVRRYCPALKNPICGQCCVSQQRREILCPQDCSFLINHKQYEIGITAFHKLLNFVQCRDLNIDEVFEKLQWHHDETDIAEYQLVHAYLAFGYTDNKGDRAVDIYLREHNNELSAPEKNALIAMQQTAWPSLFEVEAVEPGVGIWVYDCIVGKRNFILHKYITNQTNQIKKFSILLAWLVAYKNRHEFIAACCCDVPMNFRWRVQNTFNKEMRHLKQLFPDASEKTWQRQAIVAGQLARRKAILNWQPPINLMKDDDDFIICEAIFDVTDPVAIRNKLTTHPDITANDNNLVWFEHLSSKSRKKQSDKPVSLGTISFNKGRMKLATKSRKQLERGKWIITNLLPNKIARHRIDYFKDPETD